jgi:phage terminase large subunit-like protein
VAGNKSKKFEDESPGPWLAWSEPNRAERCIRFMETYCVLPKGYGSGSPMKLAPFQTEWLRNVLSDGITSAAMTVPRGNGKSTLLAGVALWALFDPDESGAPQVPVVATTINQAVRSVYGVALDMVIKCDELRTRALWHTGIGTQKIFANTGGEMFPISNDPDGLQGLDPSLAVCDEIGFMPVESWDSLLLASGKRPRSLVVGIGTPGFDKHNALWHLRERVREGNPLPGFHYTEYAAPVECAVDDEEVWAEANPALENGYMNIEALRTAVALSPEAHFRIFRLGQWIDGVESWLGTDGRAVWNALVDPFVSRPAEPAWIGVDVGLKRDSTAVCVLQRRADGRLHAFWKMWLPTKDEPVDVTQVMQYLRTCDLTFKVQGISFDPRFFDVPAKMLSDEGLPLIEVPQSLERMTPAVGSTFEAIKRGELSHDGEPIVTEQVLNAVPRWNDRGFTLTKGKSRGRIDAAVALCLAVDLALRQPGPKQMKVW